MAEMLTGINGGIIRWAREYYHMSEEEAAKAVGVDLSRYLNWESGSEFPTYAKLKTLSHIFQKPSALFFFPEPPDIKPPTGDLRTLPHDVVNRFSKDIILQFEKASAYQMNLAELYGNRYCVLSDRNSFPTGIKELCDYFRQKMQFPLKAQKARKSTKVVFEIYREKLYELGIYVFKDSFKDNSVSGLCINDDQYPVIVINNAMSFARQIFTLFHELYHLVKGTNGAEIIRDDYYQYLTPFQSTIEKECDEFANKFLIPEDDFANEISSSPLSEERIEELANLYSVSREAIMYTLLQLHKISSAEYSRMKELFYGEALRKNPKKKDSQGGGNFYATKLSYLGQQYTGEVFRQYFSGRINSIQAGEMLNSKVDHLPRLEVAFFRGVKA